MANQNTIATINRFRNYVTAHIGDGSTTYLTPDEARDIGRALIEYAGDVAACKYSDSRLNGVDIEAQDVGSRP